MCPPFLPISQGHAHIIESQEQQFRELDPKNLNLETTHVETAGDIGFSYGTYTMNLRAPDGTRLDDRGKWITAVRLENGHYRVVANCWNSDLSLRR